MTSVPPLPGKACGDDRHVPEPGWWPQPWDRRGIDAAVRVCTRYCPCLAACRKWMLTADDDQLAAVVAGLTPGQRL